MKGFKITIVFNIYFNNNYYNYNLLVKYLKNYKPHIY